ncbi:hypothetical protein, partial [Paraburkholderia aspalathi]|uniref:hypothetical protein n=1 Tax=Paraburkholderia aspalathi TaxID=1324617 RepID=UPI001BAC3371
MTRFTEGFNRFVTSTIAPVASGWSGCRVGLSPTGKAPPFHGARQERTFDMKAEIVDNLIDATVLAEDASNWLRVSIGIRVALLKENAGLREWSAAMRAMRCLVPSR